MTQVNSERILLSDNDQTGNFSTAMQLMDVSFKILQCRNKEELCDANIEKLKNELENKKRKCQDLVEQFDQGELRWTKLELMAKVDQIYNAEQLKRINTHRKLFEELHTDSSAPVEPLESPVIKQETAQKIQEQIDDKLNELNQIKKDFLSKIDTCNKEIDEKNQQICQIELRCTTSQNRNAAKLKLLRKHLKEAEIHREKTKMKLDSMKKINIK